MDDVMTGQNGGCFMKARTERGALADFQKESMNNQMFNNYSSASIINQCSTLTNYSSASIINQVHQEENLSAGAFRQTGEERSLHCQVFVFFKKVFLVLISMIFIISVMIFSITTNSIMIILITMLIKKHNCFHISAF